MMRVMIGAGLFVSLLLDVAVAETPTGEPLFVSGRGGYHTYRIPAITITTQGTVLTFCEGRKLGGGDSGDMICWSNVRLDGGTTWTEQQVIWDDAAEHMRQSIRGSRPKYGDHFLAGHLEPRR